jgi:hypothetical protein
MTDIFLERDFEPALTGQDVLDMAQDTAACFGIHRVEWRGSYLSSDGRRMFCCFSAPDMESARIAMRQSNIDSAVLWPGDVLDGPGIAESDMAKANVLVARDFAEAVTLQEIQEIEDAGIGCLQSRNVRFIRTFFSADRKRMVCLYEAPDAESVRQSQREAGVPFSDAWAVRRIAGAEMPNSSN